MDEEVLTDIAPFDMLKQTEQVTHLRHWHSNVWRSSLTSKSSKASMQTWHEHVHLSGTNIGKVHTHTAVGPVSPQLDGEPLDLTKPLSASQRKALKDLVENDFLALKAEINQFADDMAKQRRDEINRDYAARGADSPAFLQKARTLMVEYRNNVDRLVVEARTAGVELQLPDIQSRSVETKIVGLASALKAAEMEVDADRRRALNTLERARLTAQRRVLMTGVSEEALAILDTIPNARDLMLAAATERAPQSVKA